MENEIVEFTKGDPLLESNFSTVRYELSTALDSNAKLIAGFHNQLQSAELTIFSSWEHDSLLEIKQNYSTQNPYLKNPQLAADFKFSLYIKNQQLLKRIASKISKSHFPKLQDSLFLCAIAIEERTPKISISTDNQTIPFPDAGTDLLYDLVKVVDANNNLCQF